MIKLNRQTASLDTAVEKIRLKTDELIKKSDAIQDRACDENRDITASEWDKIYKWESEIFELQDERDAIEKALELLRDYAD